MAEYGNHYFFPHERWSIKFFRQRQKDHQTAPVIRMQQNYGPEGVALMGAAYANMIPGTIIVIGEVFVSIIIRSVIFGVMPWNILLAAGFLAVAFGMTRALQSSRAGRIFRAGRPFIRG